MSECKTRRFGERREPFRFTWSGAERAKKNDGPAGILQWDGPAGFIAEDLPAGRTFVVEITEGRGGAVLQTREMTLAADGDAVQKLRIGRIGP